jgi:signal transduction histidine kinase
VQKIAEGDLNIEIDEDNDIDRPKLINEFDRALGNLKTGEISRRQAVNAIRHQMARVEALSSTVSRLSTQHDLQSVLQTSCEIVVGALHISVCCIRLYEPGCDAYFLRAQHGLEPDILNDPEPLPGSICHQYAAPDSLYILNLDSRKETNLPKDLLEMRSDRIVAWVRIVHEDQNVGLLALFARDEQEASGLEDKSLLQGLADAIGLSITNAQLFDELRLEQIRRERLMKQLISAQEEERVRIARELHDETAQSLSAINVYVDTTILSIQEQALSKAVLHMELIKSLVSGTQDEIRRMIGALRPSLLDDLGLIPAISWYAEQRFNPVGINFTICENEKGIRLPTTVETPLFRIAQESINNIVRHSHASQVNIFVKKVDEEVLLGISDNGIGFEPHNGRAEAKQNNGFGLTGIYERVKNLEGNIQIDTEKGIGTKIVIRIPIQKEDSLI